jgi:5-methylcytosine-specific restriction endonuclease McrA
MTETIEARRARDKRRYRSDPKRRAHGIANLRKLTEERKQLRARMNAGNDPTFCFIGQHWWFRPPLRVHVAAPPIRAVGGFVCPVHRPEWDRARNREWYLRNYVTPTPEENAVIRARVNARYVPRPKVQAICEECDQLFAGPRGAKYCGPACRRRISDRTKEHRRRRAIMAQRHDTITTRQLAERDRWRCHLCAGPVRRDNWSIDHIRPLSMGGAHVWENVALAHWICNVRRGVSPVPSKPGQRGYRNKSNWRNTLKKQVLATTGGRCQMCGWPGTDGKGKGLQKAHVVPHRLGGPDDASNLIPLCPTCHGRMDARDRQRGEAS